MERINTEIGRIPPDAPLYGGVPDSVMKLLHKVDDAPLGLCEAGDGQERRKGSITVTIESTRVSNANSVKVVERMGQGDVGIFSPF